MEIIKKEFDGIEYYLKETKFEKYPISRWCRKMSNEDIKIDIVISDNKDYQDTIQNGIVKFNNDKHPENTIFQVYREKGYNDPFGFYVLLDNQVIGGIIARKKMQWLDIDILFVNQDFRSNRIGSQLMSKAVEYCKN